jgi:UDP-N-acetylmuramoylalanine--D-glutamate ligase
MNALPAHFKNVSVLGAGESGVAAARLLASEGVAVTVLDTAPLGNVGERALQLAEAGIPLCSGVAALEVPADTSLAVLSPGIDPASPQVQAFVRAGVPLTGELETAFQRCACPVVAITGTNGKTTTTQLVESLFNGAGLPTRACGNIGPAFSSEVSNSRNLALLTVEVSSFQLETIQTFRPKIAVWLNFAPDHLDRYASLQEYFSAKVRIFENQSPEDWAVINARDTLPPLRAKVLRFSAYEPYSQETDFTQKNGTIEFRGEPVLSLTETQLRGAHNAENLMAALACGHAWGLSWDAMRASLCAYKALPHRCEVVGTVAGVEYVNDSKATNLDAVEKALSSDTRRVVLIAGGKDKGFEFGALTELVAARCRAAVLIGEMAGRIQKCWEPSLFCLRAGSLAEAVALSRDVAEPGDLVLFSPGTSSFDMFKNYADRGNQFRALVQQLS